MASNDNSNDRNRQTTASSSSSILQRFLQSDQEHALSFIKGCSYHTRSVRPLQTRDFLPLRDIQQHRQQYHTTGMMHGMMMMMMMPTTSRYASSSTSGGGNIVLEIEGKQGSGKTELAMHLICSTLVNRHTVTYFMDKKLGRPHDGYAVDEFAEAESTADAASDQDQALSVRRLFEGNGNQIVFFDCDMKFNVIRLTTLMENKLAEVVAEIYEEEGARDGMMQQYDMSKSEGLTEYLGRGSADLGTEVYRLIVYECLSRVKIFRPYTVVECWLTLEALALQSQQQRQEYYLNTAGRGSNSDSSDSDVYFSCQLLIFDSLNAFFSPDQSSSKHDCDRISHRNWHRMIQALVKYIQQESSMTVLALKSPLYSTGTSHDFMPREWHDVCNYHMSVTRLKGHQSRHTHRPRSAVLRSVDRHNRGYGSPQSAASLQREYQFRIGHGIEWLTS